MAACLFHAPPPPMKPTKPVDWERLLLHYLPTPTVRVTVTYNKIKNAQTAVGFNFSFLYRSALGPSFLLCFFFLLPMADLVVGRELSGCRSGGGRLRLSGGKTEERLAEEGS